MDITTMSGHEGSQDDVRWTAEASGSAPVRRIDVRELEERIRHYNSDLPPQDPAFRAAVILLAGVEYGHNIDVIARRTGYDRTFVARVARRLIDNGVWKAGVTVADWSSADEASGTFWNDVAVAEGKMCRRIASDGRIEWAPAGFWNKNFGFIDPGADQRLATLYLDPRKPEVAADAVAGEAEATPGAGETLDESTGPAATQPPVTPPAASRAPATDRAGPAGPAADSEATAGLAGEEPGSESPGGREKRNGEVPSLDDLFGDVVWIG